MCRRRNVKITSDTPDTPIIDVSKLRIERINSHGSIVRGSTEYDRIIEFRKIFNSTGSIASMSHHNEHIGIAKSDSSH